MSVNRVFVLAIICLWMHCIMGQEESCRNNYEQSCLANSTLCEPYTVSSNDRCNFVRCCCSEYSSEEAIFNYLFFQYCSIWSTSIGLPNEVSNSIVMLIMGIYFILILGNVADKYFAPIMAETAETLGVSHNIAGVTFMAFANGAPDISSSVAAIQHGGEQTKLGLGALLGVAVYNPILISAVISTYAVNKPIKVVRFPFVRDCIMLFIAASLILYITLQGRIVLYEAMIMICLYVTFVASAVLREIYYKKKNKPLLQEMSGHAVSDGGKRTYHSLGKKTDDHDAVTTADAEYHPSTKHLWLSMKSEAAKSNVNDIVMDDDIDIKKKDKHWCFKVMILILRGPTIITNYLCQLTIPLTDEEHWNDTFSVITCTTAPMMTFFVFDLFEVHIGFLPVWVLALIFGLIMSGVTYYFCKKKYIMIKLNDAAEEIELNSARSTPKLSESMMGDDKGGKGEQNVDKLKSQPVMKYFFLLLGFFSAVAWINLAAVEVVNILSTLGVVASIDLAILGITVLAWGNSTPDLVADVGVSKRGYAKMGIAAAIGGPTLDVLIGVGVGTTLVCIQEGGEASIPISINIFIGCIGVMTGISLYLLFVGCNGWALNKYFGCFLFFYYATFLTVNLVAYSQDVTIA